MIRPIRYTFLSVALIAVAGLSFAVGRNLHVVAAGPIEVRTRVTSLPELNIGNTARSAFQADSDVDPADTFRDVLRHVDSDYVDRVNNDQKLGFGAVKAMLASLDDPKTRFLDPNQKKALVDQLNGKFSGIGAVLTVVKQSRPIAGSTQTVEQRRLAVVAPVPGGPADKAGLRPGDVITNVDTHWIIAYDPREDLDQLHKQVGTDDPTFRKQYKEAVDKLSQGISLPKALDELTGKPGATYKLTVERPGQKDPLTVSVTTADTAVEPVEYKALSGGTGYLRVTQFSDAATTAFSAALADAAQKSVRSLVVDLRDNAGGPVTARDSGAYGSALALLARLTPGGQVGEILRKGNQRENVTVSGAAGSQFKLVVLVNGGTANLAELVAAGLKERAGATLVGSHTFGDSVCQNMVDLRDGAAMTLTAGKILTARGIDFSNTGLTPDIAMATGGPGSTDATVQRALGALAGA